MNSRASTPLANVYKRAIGKPRDSLSTPTLILDLDVVRRNVAEMGAWCRDHTNVRPHAKTHKSPEIARLQLDAGAVGITTATAWEALEMAKAGIDGILVANEVMGQDKLDALTQAAALADVIVAVDSSAVAQELSRSARAAGMEIGVLVEIDVGMHRGGVRDLDEARAVAKEVTTLGGLKFRGVMGYEGHTVLERDRAKRERNVHAAMADLLHYVAALREDGHDVAVVSAGGTNTHDITGTIPGVTELQAGTYALMDTSYVDFAPKFQPALTVSGRVISRHGNRVVLDCGSKVLGPSPLALPRPLGVPGQVVAVHEEHTLLDIEGSQPQVGDRMELIVGYAGGAVNANDAYHVVERGTVVDIWPIRARATGIPFHVGG